MDNANSKCNNLLLEYNQLEKDHKNTEMIEIKDELDKKNDISNLKDSINGFKRKNLIVNKNKKEIEELKETNEYEDYFNNEEKKRIKKTSEINELKKINGKYKQEIQDLKEKLKDKNTDDDM